MRVRKLWALGAVVITAALALPIRVGIVWGESMAPAMSSGQLYLMDRAYYNTHPVRRGDVVVFDRDGTTYMKRVLALGGDRLHLLAFQSLDEDQLVPHWQLPAVRRLMNTRYTRTARLVERLVPPGFCYVVGDHLAVSTDSRRLGPVSLDEIRGKVLTAGAAPGGNEFVNRAQQLAASSQGVRAGG